MKKPILPLIKGYRATTYTHAFTINAFVAALVASIAIETRFFIYNEEDSIIKITGRKLYAYEKILCVFLTTFIITVIIYCLLYITIGFGGGMLSPWTPIKTPKILL